MLTAVARLTLVAGLMLGMVGLARSQDAAPRRPALMLSGGDVSTQVTAASLAALPRIAQTVTFATSKGEMTGVFEGVLLWELMKSAGIVAQPGNHFELRQTFMVAGRDNYAIAFSMGEISPEFGNKAIMIADRVDGKVLTLQDGFRLIVPGDKRGARSVRYVAKIEVR